MPSNSFNTFRYNLVDVDRLTESHEALRGTNQGKKGLGHITRSAIVMLCASWEMYVEHLLLEGIDYLTSHVKSPDELPMPVQKELASAVRNSKHDLKPLALAGTGWKQVLKDHGSNETDRLNTPKSTNINLLFVSLLGISRLSDSWEISAEIVDEFVSARGEIAHRGRHAPYTQLGKLNDHKSNIYRVACNTDNHVSESIKAIITNGRKPWNYVG